MGMDSTLTELVKIAFQQLLLEKVILSVFDFNTSAIACYEKAGFKKINFRNNAKEFSTGWCGAYVMQIIKNGVELDA
jgi:RimJ/RimL family protein N-acetyltransferase